MEAAVFEHVLEDEQNGFDAVIVGCCYDPGVRVARELVDIPVIGPLEAALAFAPYVGHSTVVVTDHRKAVPYLEDLVRLYDRERFCRRVDCIDWWVTDMVNAPLDTARDAYRKCRQVLEHEQAESVIVGCTIVAACLEYAILHGSREYVSLPMVNPNLAALKMAEALADLRKQGRYTLNRRGYYGHPRDHDREEYEDTLRVYTRLGRGRM
jgi:allantoin racemase